MARRKPRLAVWKFASCDGCQLTLLDCEDQLLELAGAVEFANFPEATRIIARGPYDLSIVEGSITTAHDAERIHAVRRASKYLMAAGACATAGGIQALRNFTDVNGWVPLVYATPHYIQTLRTSTPFADHVKVDYELWGCPPNKNQFLEAIRAVLAGQRPVLEANPVCMQCKRNGNPCVVVTRGIACLGPVTRTGCGALCPAYGRGCYGCFGPVREARTARMDEVLGELGLDEAARARAYRHVNAAAPAFRKAGDANERKE